jgi:hypothetical protein
MSFALRATQPYYANPVIPSSLVMPLCLSLRVRLSNYTLTFSIRQFGCIS